MVLFRFAKGQVIEQRGVWDSLSAMQQLGVVQGIGQTYRGERGNTP